jgi:colanic acid biosynthesis glycosyl transferase WcaI
MAQLCEELQRHGHEISVITAFPHYAEFRVWDDYRGRLAQLDHYRGMRVLRLAVFASGRKQQMLHRLANYLSFNALATLATLVWRQRYDVVLCPNGSFFTGVAAFLSGLWTRAPFVYNVQDLYPEVPAQAGQLHNTSSVVILQHIARFMYRTAAHITVITPTFREYIISQGIPAEKISVIPNFVNTAFIRPLPRANPVRKRLGLADAWVVLYAGNMGYVSDLGTLLEAAARLRASPDIVFVLVGDGVARPELERKARELALDNVRFLPFMPYDDMPSLYAVADVQVSLYKYGAAKHSMPSKIYEIMASGRPLLASADPGSDVRALVDTTGCGLSVDPEDADQLADALLALYGDPARCEEMARRGRQCAEHNHSREAVGAHYNALLQQVAARHSRKR